MAHKLEKILGLTSSEILDSIGARSRLLTNVRGAVAEHHLQKVLEKVCGRANVEMIDKDGQPDFRIKFSGTSMLVECKNVRSIKKEGRLWVEMKKTRRGSDPCKRYYEVGHFQILAACLQPLTQKWEFRYCDTSVLPQQPGCKGRWADTVFVDTKDWTPDLTKLLKRITK